MQRFVKLGAAMFGAALLVAACGGSSSKTSAGGATTTSAAGSGSSANASTTVGGGSGGNGSQPASDTACNLVTQAEATTLFGTAATQIADSSPVNLATSVCLWSAKPDRLLSYLLQIRVYDRAVFYTGNLPGYSPLPGVADRAAINVLPGGSTIMTSYQKGNTVVSISYGVHQITTGERKTAEAQKDQLVALVKQAAGR